MRIEEIHVTGLFGVLNHHIPLNPSDRITIIHGLNGTGKTTLLKMLHGLFTGCSSELREIPFTILSIDFQDKERANLAPKDGQLVLTVGGQSYTVPDEKKKNIEEDTPLHGSQTRARHNSQTAFADYAKTSILGNYNNVVINYAGQGYHEALAISQSEESKTILEIWKTTGLHLNTHLIETNRLTSESQGIRKHPFLSTSSVIKSSQDLSESIQNKQSEYGQLAQQLDRSFPARVLELSSDRLLSLEKLREKFDEIETKRSRIISTGIINLHQEPSISLPDEMSPDMQKFIQVYIEDSEQKLNILQNLARKVETLTRIINAKFMDYKTMHVSPEEGFVFSTHPNGDKLTPDKLSFGEQNLLVMFYELLFKVEPGSLVLIDEPEISLHVGWQVHFIEDLQEIVNLADIDVIIATHSPSIIHDRWDLTVELKGPEA